MQIEQKLPERALQPRQALLQHDKTRAGNFAASLEIHLAERFAEFEMLLRLEGVIALLAPTRDARHCRARPCRPARRRAACSGFARAPCRVRRPSFFCLCFQLPESSSSTRATSAISFCARASSFFALASPISFDAALRRACACSSLVMAARRRFVELDQLAPTAAPARAASGPRSKACGMLANPFDVVHGGDFIAGLSRVMKAGRCLLEAMRRRSEQARRCPQKAWRYPPDGPASPAVSALAHSAGLAALARRRPWRAFAARRLRLLLDERTDQIEPS